jgi:carboxylesterase type B
VTPWRKDMKVLLQIVASLVLLCHFSYARTSSGLRVRIDDGKILGKHMTTLSGRSIRAFMGIPYAAPPVGDLRFKPPQKVEMWRNVLLAHKEPPKCTQIDLFQRLDYVVEGQEDCLYLNVYTPVIRKKEDKNKRFPVMVWIHGGVS